MRLLNKIHRRHHAGRQVKKSAWHGVGLWELRIRGVSPLTLSGCVAGGVSDARQGLPCVLDRAITYCVRWPMPYEVSGSSQPWEGWLWSESNVQDLGHRAGLLLSDHDLHGRCPLGPARLGGLLPSGVGRG